MPFEKCPWAPFTSDNTSHGYRVTMLVNRFSRVLELLRDYEGEEIVADVHPLHIAVTFAEQLCYQRHNNHPMLFRPAGSEWLNIIWKSRDYDRMADESMEDLVNRFRATIENMIDDRFEAECIFNPLRSDSEQQELNDFYSTAEP